MTDTSRELTLLYVHSNSMGYGRMGVSLAAGVEAKGVTVYTGLDSAYDDHATRKLAGEGPRTYGKTDTVCWVSVPTHARGWYQGQQSIIATMWEAQKLPAPFRENLYAFDTVIVPSMHNVELFGRYHNNVQYMPLGIDPVRWQYRKRTQPTTRFNFLIGGSGQRKGTDLAVRAFRRVFGEEGSWPAFGPVPYLVMKSPKFEDLGTHRRIEVINGRLTDEEEIELYASAHCYLQPSRGEGFGLQPLQAIAQGCPTILTDAHGHEAFAHLGIGISAGSSPSAYFIYGDAGEWWEPNLDELCEAMFWTYHNYGEATKQADMASHVALTAFTWERTANRFLDICGDRLGPYTGNGDWVEPLSKLYPARSLVGQRFDAGGVDYVFHPGEELWVPADVKRIMFEAGTLDPTSCEGDDPGLLPGQIADLGGYIAKHRDCPTCHQPMNQAA